MEPTFDDIRPFRTEEEVQQAIQRLKDDQFFFQIANQVFKGKTLEKKVSELSKVKTTDDFQANIAKPLLKKLIKKTSDGFTITGLDNLEKDKAYLFMSNHRDIIMDPALLSYGLMKNGFLTTEIAIGSNLLLQQWIIDLVKLNKSFVVKRGDLGIKEQLVSSKALSSYIYDSITRRNASIWIAQREGRTKNGYDETQLSLLKMLNLAGNGNTRKIFKELNIVPVSISYEYEPSDGLKTRELYMRDTPEGFVKTPQDDLDSMFLSLKQPKGRIHFAIGEPIGEDVIDRFGEELTDAEIIERLAHHIDKHIVTNYRLFPDNYIALDMLKGSQKYKNYYTTAEKEQFIKHMELKLESINGTTGIHRELFLKIYANPILHKEEYKKIQE
ncbi:acyltransferase-like protein [Balneicella halophila]|uniref:Acyltransferase-like protein n=1 Tax=Balneicella halophila TaxID=1537566 RepID=A0A7L4UNX2_BALHA|nr:1-acyl-sn-glycerol-3-phosphate acyltransferase [Balneicella halophila]PVX49373.1 acyltransferase-like protein [Balneicella halophila]